MVSVLGDYNYTFPKPIPLKLKLKDMLEDNVDEKYYIEDDLLQHIIKTKQEHPEYTQYDRYNGEFEQLCRVWKDKAPTLHTKSKDVKIYEYKKQLTGTITTGEGSKPSSNYIIDNDDYGYSKEKGKIIKIKNATAKGYLEATDGDGIDLAQPNSETRRGRVKKETIQTLTTQNNLGVCVYDFDSSEKFLKNGNRDLGEQDKFPTLLAKGQKYGVYKNDLRIRKLTPRECFKLMGVKDEDYEKVAKNQSDSSLYHLAGDSIVVDVIKAIIKEMV